MYHDTIEIDTVFEKLGQSGVFTPEEELLFYREILARTKVNIYINQIDDIDDFTTARMIWTNKACEESMGYTLQEAKEMGYQLFIDCIHPDDRGVTSQAIDFHSLKLGDCYGGLARFVNRKKEGMWFLGNNVVLSIKNGKPWQFLNVALNIQDELHAQKQLLELQHENSCLKNALKIKSLSKREKAILVQIAHGRTDKEIAAGLIISVLTVRTHHKNLLRKLGKNKTAELAVFAVESGLI